MNKFVIVLADAGLSGNFLVRLINFSRAIQWDSEQNRSHEIVSETADDQYVRYCWTSLCHTSVGATAHPLAQNWYRQHRTNLTADAWRGIKVGSNRPSAWFFHNIEPEIYTDPDTVVVRVEPGTDFNIQFMLDRWWFCDDDLDDIAKRHHNALQWYKKSLSIVSHKATNLYNDGHLTIKNAHIFNTVRVLELMKELDLYHTGLTDIIHDWIRVYEMKNTRPRGLFSCAAPEEYIHADRVDAIPDPVIRHYMKCVNRTRWPELDVIDDPYDYIVQFRQDILNERPFSESMNDAIERFYNWKSRICAK